MIRRIVNNTMKQILRGGWTSWASVSVMTLAYLVGSIFVGLAYFAHLNIKKIESRNNMIVFFEVGIDREIIDRLWNKWKEYPQIKEITFTSEEEAYKMFSDYTARVSPIHYETLKSFREPKLNSSLDIKLVTLDDFENLKSLLQKDIEEENRKLIILDLSNQDKKENNDLQTENNQNINLNLIDGNKEILNNSTNNNSGTEVIRYRFSNVDGKPPIILKSDDTRLEQQREIFNSLRVAGIVIIVLLFIVIFFFTFMTVEFRLYNQMEEIGVMQLVGGSLFFIRMPYILEGGFYGLLGALISSLLIGLILVSVFVWDANSVVARFFFENFGDLEWPYISEVGWIVLVLLISISGFLIGAFSSFFSIRRYIR